MRVARRKVLYLHDAAELNDLRVPPGKRLELLKGRWKGYHSHGAGISPQALPSRLSADLPDRPAPPD
jgi:hypothetical protein